MPTRNAYPDLQAPSICGKNHHMGTFSKVGENLVRHDGSGTIYLRAKVNGKPIRTSLDTTDLTTAKEKRDPELKRLRKQARQTVRSETTLSGALTAIEKAHVHDPRLKLSTRKSYEETYKALRRSLPLKRNLKEWKAADARAWWAATAAKASPQRANHLLALVKRLGAYIAEQGIADDPTLKLRRVVVTKRVPFSPSREQVDAIIESIRSQKKAASKTAAAFVGFLAFSGCRISEARNLKWSDISEEWITITGGKHGTKNRRTRHLPLNAPLREILQGLRPPDAAGPVFQLGRPREALNGATERLGLPHLRIHDLRHFFTTWALENGVDIAALAAWLGHQDGGVLLLATYGHLRDSHSLTNAGKLG